MRRENRGTLQIDTVTIIFLAVMFILAVLLPYINPVTQESKEQDKSQGHISVELFWVDDKNIDLDLWMLSPKDSRPVGYTNKGDVVFNLLRDDLGTANDLSKRNMEIGYTRGVPDGEYIINVHLYARKEGVLPINFKLVITLRTETGSTTQLFLEDQAMTEDRQEKTVVRFLMKDGKFVKNSRTYLQQPLRSIQ